MDQRSDPIAIANPDHGGAQSILRAATLLRAVGLKQSVGLTALANETGISKPTVRRILVALMKAGLVEQDTKTKQYSLGVDAYLLGQLAKTPYDFHELSTNSIVRLAALSGDSAYLSIRQNQSTLCIHREEGKYPIRTHVLDVGHRQPMPIGAASMAVLAQLPEMEAREIIENNSSRILEKYPKIDIDQIYLLITEARAQGWALNPGLVFPGSWAIAAAVRDPAGRTIGAITIAAIEERLAPSRQKELAPSLLAEADNVERLMRNAYEAKRPVASLFTPIVKGATK